MKFPLDKFWAKSDEKFMPASEKTITDTEKRLEIRLPDIIKDLYKIQDGGYTDYKSYKNQSKYFKNFVIQDQYLRPLRQWESMNELGNEIDFPSDQENWNLILKDTQKLITISNHGSDYYLCLDFRNTNSPGIVLIDTVISPKEALKIVSLEDFFNGLSKEDPNEISLEETDEDEIWEEEEIDIEELEKTNIEKSIQELDKQISEKWKTEKLFAPSLEGYKSAFKISESFLDEDLFSKLLLTQVDTAYKFGKIKEARVFLDFYTKFKPEQATTDIIKVWIDKLNAAK